MQMISEAVTDDLGNTLIKVTMTTEKGRVSRRTISLEDYISLLNGSIKVERTYFRMEKDFLPEGYIDGSFHDRQNYTAVWLEKGQVRQLVHDSGHYMIPFPDIVFAIRVEKGRVRSQMCFVLDSDRESLKQYPFGNVSTCGHICTGSITIEGLDESISVFSEEFFMGKTNNDYFHEGSHIVPKYSQEELLRKLDGKKEFPKRWLKPASGEFKTLTGLRNYYCKQAA